MDNVFQFLLLTGCFCMMVSAFSHPKHMYVLNFRVKSKLVSLKSSNQMKSSDFSEGGLSRRSMLGALIAGIGMTSFTGNAYALGSDTLKNRSPIELQFEMFKEALDLVDEEKYDEAESLYTDIIEEFETPLSRLYGRGSNLLARAYNMRGQMRLNLERPEDALNDFSKAINLVPDKPEYWYYKGISYQMIGDMKLQDAVKARQFYASALQSFENALILDSSDPQLYQKRAESLVFMGEHQQALSNFKKASALNPFDPDLKTKLALEQIQCGDVKSGGKLLEKTLFFAPGNPQTNLAVAALYWQYGRLAESADLFQSAVSMDPRLADDRFLLVGLRWPPVALNLVAQMIYPQQRNSISNKIQSIGMFAGNEDNVL
mmetsp:Transcript_38044/g.48510  ORF Transcript_38044/g.48510 Transcript_38044/m.48510 type:complete len:374 (-) Transcript_38044:637-1758(-)